MTVDFDGKIWKPIPGGTATAEEFIAAYSLIREIHRLLLWSPWVMQDRAKEYDAAWKTCEQWTSTEPGPSAGKTVEEHMAEVEQRLAEADARFLAEEAQAEKDRAERATRYDSERAEARLAMLEEQGILADKIRERDEIVSGELFPLVSENKRRELLGAWSGTSPPRRKR